MSGDVKREWFEVDYYAVLGVADGASQSEITKAYRKLAREFHPDRNAGDASAEDRFKEISAAYDVVGDEERRAEYDQVRRLGAMGGGGFGGGGGPGGGFSFDAGDMGDLGGLLGQMFGGGAGGGLFGDQPGGRYARIRPGRDQEASLAISFDEAVRGAMTTLALTDERGRREIKVRIPAGVESGQRIRLRGKGGSGQPPGDLYVTVEVADHPMFRRDKGRLGVEVPITYAEAVLGADVEVPTYQGELVTVRIPPGTQHGRTLRVRGAGAGTDDGPGDLFVTVHLTVPGSLSDDAVEALRKYEAAAGESPRSDPDDGSD